MMLSNVDILRRLRRGPTTTASEDDSRRGISAEATVKSRELAAAEAERRVNHRLGRGHGGTILADGVIKIVYNNDAMTTGDPRPAV